jgi:hypothetical protein
LQKTNIKQQRRHETWLTMGKKHRQPWDEGASADDAFWVSSAPFCRIHSGQLAVLSRNPDDTYPSQPREQDFA